MKTPKTLMAAAAMVAMMGAAQAAPVFQGRLTDGTASATCTKSGATKCAMYYNTTLDITILNDWSIGTGFWSATAAAGSAQALAESAGAAQTAFTGWFLPTGDGSQGAGAPNQYRSILNDVGYTLAGFQAQFDGVQSGCCYWSSTEFDLVDAWAIDSSGGFYQNSKLSEFRAAAVRPGDVTASVPEPQTLALALMALGAMLVVRRRRPG